ncbi:MAG: TIGR03936 family radical SAM-associated protein [Eubacteriales bacterium]
MTDRIVFSKSKQARYISHLDLMRTFQRGFNRAGIEIRHTEGFHPHPFVSIALPLSLGFSSECEILEFGLVSGSTREELPQKLTEVLPEGIDILSCYEGEIKLKHIIFLEYLLTLDYGDAVPQGAEAAWQSFLSQESLVVEKKSKKSKKGFVSLDIMPMIHQSAIEIQGSHLMIKTLLTAQNPGLNPELIRKAFVEQNPELAPKFMYCHRLEIYNKDREVFR